MRQVSETAPSPASASSAKASSMGSRSSSPGEAASGEAASRAARRRAERIMRSLSLQRRSGPSAGGRERALTTESAQSIRVEPGQVGRQALAHGQGDQLRRLVRVQGAQARLQARIAAPGGLDEQQDLAVLADFPLPAVDRGGERRPADTGGQTLADQGARQAGGGGLVR